MKKRLFILFILLIVLITNFSILADDIVSVPSSEVQCNDCSGYITSSSEPRMHHAKKGENYSHCYDCSRDFTHYRANEYLDIEYKCNGTCGFKSKYNMLLRSYCVNNY